MVYQNFEQVMEVVRKKPKRRVIVAGAEEKHVIEAVYKAKNENIVDVILVGDKSKIISIFDLLGYNAADIEIVNCLCDQNPSQVALDVINSGSNGFLMKGRIETRDLLKPVVDKTNGMYIGRTMTHFTLSKVPGYSRLVSLTDSAMQIYPDLAAKKDMIVNAVENLRKIGYERPKVAVICAIEKVNPKMTETVDAETLAKMNQSGEITDCDIVGPISYDLAMSEESAKIKGYDCPWCGKFDLLVLPNLVAANVLAKSWSVTAGGCNAGMIAGAKIPIALVSRGTTAEEKLMSIALCALATDEM